MASAALKVEDDRAIPRTRVLLTGMLMTPDGAVRVRVHDISSCGAQIWAEQPISAGCDALFKRGKLFAAAKIIWSEERRAGLSFYRQLTREEFELNALA